ncbi:MAG: single-stranded-DNA-specific exonuclease RecJ, partial [Solirubrobacterales bacterium]|nr:single-stranded-DNA-specific exonuclease RecJ [Solirubrobacterales bacterium]
FLAAADRHPAESLPAVGEACEAILRHVSAGTPIAVFGDYDVDGVCATAILVRALRALGASPRWRLPSRDEGYGLSAAAVRELAAQGARLIVTVDCGVTAVEEVALARELGVEVVVTDHHRPGERLPDCPVVHPALGGYGCEHLCGAAVALKLSEALRRAAGADPAGADEDLDLAGLATVCDMVALTGESRRIAREGIAALSRTRKDGLRALMAVAQLAPAEVDERTASFRLGPRINAAGRMRRADAALELVLCEDRERADEIARELDGLNHDRRAAEQRIAAEAERQCAPQLAAAAIVVAGEDWHPGVVGIVASRLVERHHRPCVAIALDGDSGRGSGRSIAPYDLHAGLAATGEHLLGHGGHRMAAGLEIAADAVEPFRAALADHAGARLTPADLAPVQHVDAVVSAAALTLDLAEDLERLAPFGAGNPAPVLLVPGARIEHVTAMGKDGDHARFSLAGGAARARGVAFGVRQRPLAEAGTVARDVAVALERNHYNGAVEARVVLKSLAATRPGAVVDAVPAPALAEAIAAELAADPLAWWASGGGPDAAPARTAPRDRRGDGLGGVLGDLLTSGEPVVALVADLPRRRDGLEALIAGMAADGLAVAEWEGALADPAALAGFAHVVAVDPPPVADALERLTGSWDGGRPGAGATAGAAPGRAPALHLAWGEPEREFALAAWRARLELRPPLIELWRALDAAGELAGADLDAALRGDGRHPRDARLCGRLVRVLTELDLAAWDGATLQRGPGGRTDLANSHAHRAYAARLAAAERHLSAPERPAARAAV